MTGGAVDLTGLSVTTPVLPAGRRLRISGHAFAFGTTALGEADFGIYEGGTILNRRRFYSPVAGNDGGGSIVAIVTPTAAAHTYKLVFGRASGTGTWTMLATATDPASILVEDIGPV
jgi:hypothetical protein